MSSQTYGIAFNKIILISGFQDQNKLYNVMLVENDVAKREKYYEQLNKMAVDDYCLVVPLFGLQNISAKSPQVHDLGLGNRATSEFLPERAWLSK